MNPDLLFVYGTLRRTCSTGAHHKFLEGARFIGNAKVRGKLYRVSYYPALVLAESPSDDSRWVAGEVYQLISAAQLSALDAYEECDYPAHPNQEYQRKIYEVITDSGEKIMAWIYTYQYPVADLQLIASGDFLNP